MDHSKFFYFLFVLIITSKILTSKIISTNYTNITLYDRDKILQQFADVLNYTSGKYHSNTIYYRIKENGDPINFFVYDLTDTTNHTLERKLIHFQEGHIYHFSSFDYYHLLSNICILWSGKIILFQSINCKNSNDSLEDVLLYLNGFLEQNPNKNEIIKRVKNYKKYGEYMQECVMTSPICE